MSVHITCPLYLLLVHLLSSQISMHLIIEFFVPNAVKKRTILSMVSSKPPIGQIAAECQSVDVYASSGIVLEMHSLGMARPTLESLYPQARKLQFELKMQMSYLESGRTGGKTDAELQAEARENVNTLEH